MARSKSRNVGLIHPLLSTASSLTRRGEAVLPLFGTDRGRCECGNLECDRPGKHPRIPGGLRSASNDLKLVEHWLQKWPRSNLGWVMGGPRGVFALDIDGEEGERSLAALQQTCGALPATMEVRTGNGRHIFYFTHEVVSSSAGKLGQGLDVRGDGSYVVTAFSTHASGRLYRCVSGKLPIRRAPDALLALLVKRKADASPASHDTDSVHDISAWAEAAIAEEVAIIRAASQGTRNDELNRAAFKLGQIMDDAGISRQRIEQDLHRAASASGLTDSEIAATIASGLNSGLKSPRKRNQPAPSLPVASAVDPLAEELSKLGETDADLAERFAIRCREVAVYTPGRGYLIYDGKVWLPDNVHRRHLLAEQTARAIEREAEYLPGNSERIARARFSDASLSKGALDRMTELAKARLAVADVVLDADQNLLNVQNGTVDLKTGTFRKHRAADYFTKIAAVSYDVNASCPSFTAFIRHALNDDLEVVRYVQKAVGLSLTGDVSQHIFFFVYGPGRTGKSTFINLIRDILGDYGLHTPTETLLAKSYDNSIPNDLARLAGARMVTAIEANWNKQIDEARIKAITGGEPIAARFMRQEYFQFTPAFKLWFVANDFPQVRGTAGAFFERVRVIPFLRPVPEGQRDYTLSARLHEEASGILNWALEGCRLFQREGLRMPDAVRQASGLWRQSADHVRKFIDDCLIREPGSKTGSQMVHDIYGAWCRTKGETPLGIARFGSQLQQHDITKKRDNTGTVWVGIKLRL